MRVPARSWLIASAFSVVALQATPRIRGTVDLTIGGGEDAAEEYTFGRIAGLAQDREGRIFVADGQDQNVRVYSSAGKFLFTFGRKGAGPGEFGILGAIAFAPDGKLWTRDEGNFRFQAFSVGPTKAEYLSARRMQQHARGIHQPIIFDARGNVVELGRVNLPNASPYQYVRMSIDSSGNVIASDTSAAPPEDSLGVRNIRMPPNPSCMEGCMISRYLYQPFGATPLNAFAPNGDMALAISSSYSVSVIALGGKRLHLLKRAGEGPVPTAKERAAAEKQFDETLADLKMSRTTAPFRPLARKPVLYGMKYATTGELWVQRTTASDTSQEADVYDKSGKLVAIAEWPAKLGLLTYRTEVSGRAALAVALDSLDVERVVRVRFK